MFCKNNVPMTFKFNFPVWRGRREPGCQEGWARRASCERVDWRGVQGAGWGWPSCFPCVSSAPATTRPSLSRTWTSPTPPCGLQTSRGSPSSASLVLRRRVSILSSFTESNFRPNIYPGVYVSILVDLYSSIDNIFMFLWVTHETFYVPGLTLIYAHYHSSHPSSHKLTTKVYVGPAHEPKQLLNTCFWKSWKAKMSNIFKSHRCTTSYKILETYNIFCVQPWCGTKHTKKLS